MTHNFLRFLSYTDALKYFFPRVNLHVHWNSLQPTVVASVAVKLKLSTLGKFSVDDILKYFSCFSQKTGFDISCKLSPEVQIVSLGEN